MEASLETLGGNFETPFGLAAPMTTSPLVGTFDTPHGPAAPMEQTTQPRNGRKFWILVLIVLAVLYFRKRK